MSDMIIYEIEISLQFCKPFAIFDSSLKWYLLNELTIWIVGPADW
jgi:hypothetical protein